MDYIKFPIVVTTLCFIFTACSNSKYTVDISAMPAKERQTYEQSIKENLIKHDQAKSDAEKKSSAQELGFGYMTLGQYDKSIPYYKEVLKYDKQNYQALNNLAIIYEEAGEIPTALTFEQQAYELNPQYVQTLSILIRLLIENKQYDDAEGVLKTFAKNDKGQNAAFVGEQFAAIDKGRKHNSSSK